MTRCRAAEPCQFCEVPLDEIKIGFGGAAVGRKAVAYPSHKLIMIDSAYWDSIPTVEGRQAILAHERGHIEGARCEPCADFRAGEILRREGVPTPRDGARHLTATLDNRDPDLARANFLAGYGIDDPSGPFLHNAERARGVKPAMTAFLQRLASEGVSYQGKRYHVTVGEHGGVRTDAEQLALYYKGRARKQSDDSQWIVTDPKAIVTYAQTARETAHGRGEAVDVWVMVDGRPLLYPRDSPLFFPLYNALGAIGESMGLEWGGRWTKLPDWGHFETKTSAPALAGGVALLALLLAIFYR